MAVPASFSKCAQVGETEDGGALVLVAIPPEILKRLQTRANTADMGMYLWENVFHSALASHVY